MFAQFVLFDGFDPLDVIAPLEVLHAAGMLTAGSVRVELVSAEGAREVPSGMAGIALRAVAAPDPERADVLVLPGALGRMPGPGSTPAGETSPGAGEPAEDIPGLLRRALEGPLPEVIARALAHEDTVLACVCGGSLLPAMAGMITGRPATTHPSGTEVLAGTGAVVVDARVVDDGDLVSAGGVTSGLDLALHLVDRELGPDVALGVERILVHERRGTVWSARGPVPA
ncbi:DJ-1/PfpI family protein, partial [Streptomyces calidiresistens]